MSDEQKKSKIFENIANKPINNEQDAEMAIEEAASSIDSFFNQTLAELSSLDKNSSEEDNAEKVLEILDKVKDELSSGLESLNLEAGDQGVEMPSQENIDEALKALGPDVERKFSEMMGKTQGKIEDLKKTLGDKLNLSEEEIKSLSENPDKKPVSKGSSFMGHGHIKG